MTEYARGKYLHTKHYLVNYKDKLVSPVAFDSAYEAMQYSKEHGLFKQGYNAAMKGGTVIAAIGSGRLREVHDIVEFGTDGKKAVPQSGTYRFLPEGLRKKLPPLYSQEEVKDPMVWVKFFTPWSNWTWYGYEFDGEDLFFGWVVGLEKELGYFSLSEMQSVTGPMGLKIERDIHFEPKPLSQVMAKHGESLPMIKSIPKVERLQECSAKPGWQMTRREYCDPCTLPKGWEAKGYKPIMKKSSGRPFGRQVEYMARVITPGGETLWPVDHFGFMWTRAKYNDDHPWKVEAALKQGLPVPAKVLADYPNLKGGK